MSICLPVCLRNVCDRKNTAIAFKLDKKFESSCTQPDIDIEPSRLKDTTIVQPNLRPPLFSKIKNISFLVRYLQTAIGTTKKNWHLYSIGGAATPRPRLLNIVEY